MKKYFSIFTIGVALAASLSSCDQTDAEADKDATPAD